MNLCNEYEKSFLNVDCFSCKLTVKLDFPPLHNPLLRHSIHQQTLLTVLHYLYFAELAWFTVFMEALG